MAEDVFRFEVGELDCLVVSDGPRVYPDPAAILFAGAPRDELRETLRGYHIALDEWKEWVAIYRALLIRTAYHMVLVDTGGGDLSPTTGRLLPNLQAEGISPEEIDTIILTHAHRDHICGVLDREGRPAFPNARYVMDRAEWSFWMGTSEDSALAVPKPHVQGMRSTVRAYLAPLQARMALTEGEAEIAPGIRLLPIPGHTPGQVAVAACSEGEQLLYVSDAPVHPIHLEHPDWHLSVDVDPKMAASTIRRICERAHAARALVLAPHFPFPGLGRIVRSPDRWAWEPITVA